ncbi:unnamed protein product, partial [Mesorhabditis spiculigera]
MFTASYGIVNPSQEFLTQWINETYTDRGATLSEEKLNFIWSIVVGSITLGALAGSLLVRTLAEGFGRRNGLILNGVFNVAGAVCQFVAKPTSSPEILIIGRFVLGANLGVASGIVPMYLMELTPAKYRGAAGTMHAVALSFADWFCLFIGLPEVLGGKDYWPYAFALPGVPALALVLILPFCPESPKYLLNSRGNRDAAFRAIDVLVCDESSTDLYKDLVRNCGEDKRKRGTFRELFSRPDLRMPLYVSLFVMFAQQFTGCTAIFAYSTDMFIEAAIEPQIARYATLAIGIAYFLCACMAPLLIDRLAACLLSLIGLALFTGLQQYAEIGWARYGTIGSLITYMCFYGVGSPIPWMITGELFSQQFRSTAVTVSVFSVFAIACVVSTSYLPFKELVGITFSYTPFIVVTAVCVVVMYFILPETKNRDIDDMSGEVWTLEQSTTGFQHEELRNETESPVNSITSKELSTDKF